MEQTSTVTEQLQQIQQRIHTAHQKGLRSGAPAPQLIAVSKQQPVKRITEALEAGQRDFGENYLQPAQALWPEFKNRYPSLRLHMIGPLQSNKAKEAIALFDVIHTLATASLAEKLARLAQEGRRLPELLLQVNTGSEPQKSGLLPEELPAFLTACRQQWSLPVSGLMCIPPEEDDPRLHFALLRKLADRHNLPKLSMGMSGDYEAAARMGATYLRVGSALFGERQPSVAGGDR